MGEHARLRIELGDVDDIGPGGRRVDRQFIGLAIDRQAGGACRMCHGRPLFVVAGRTPMGRTRRNRIPVLRTVPLGLVPPAALAVAVGRLGQPCEGLLAADDEHHVEDAWRYAAPGKGGPERACELAEF